MKGKKKMLELKKISKIYETDGFKQKALDEVSVNFRENEFASILGPSGSGKTTMLNIIGGLDQYDSGELLINGVSTKKFEDRDWDSYRNHRIGFVFQSYNLITHQSILSNVELALTLSGISKEERRKRAIEALKEVGLEKHINKKPNQLSGGQMQRVAIARALINNPDILLADEPTGAIDSETSVQIMDLLKEIAKDKLVIMVTHNPELAEKYSTRIIKVKDGHIIDDSNPYHDKDKKETTKNNVGKDKKTSMSFFTALSLSLNNLMTKKGRTLLTAFAGSIGIIGIALILSLSNGVQEYINKVQKETLSSYPLSIESNSIDLSSLMSTMTNKNEDITCEENKICTTDDISSSPYLTLQSSYITNNLIGFKSYLDNNGGNIKDYVTDIQYTYNLDLQLYSSNTDDGITQVNPNTFTLSDDNTSSSQGGMGIMMGSSTSNIFSELINSEDLMNSQYDLLSGRLPEKYNEMVLVVNDDNTIPLSLMYSLDIENRSEISEIITKIKNGEDVSLDSINYSYEDLIGLSYKLVLNTDYYVKEDGNWVDKSNNTSYMKNLIENAINVEIVGVLKISDDAVYASSGFVGYTHDLTEYVINEINKTAIAKEQTSNETIDVFTGQKFDGFKTTYEDNLTTLGIANLDKPKSINIYPKDFDSKEAIENIIKEFNETASEEDKISYTDMVGTLLSGVTSIVNVISYILIAFVAISLIVSSIMIAIITYISVLERTKEIGILRAIGASKKDVSRVFNAETIIEGFIAGFLGVGISLLLCIPINAIVYSLFTVNNIASLPVVGAIILIVISVLLTVVAGIIPARMASKKDPVEALRNE